MLKTLARLIGLAMLLFATLALAQQPIPPLKARVTDLTGTFSPAQIAELDNILAQFEARKGAQVVVLMVPTTEPEVIEEYSIRLAEAWKVGRKDINDGAILLIAKNDKRMRIEVGYGLEGILPDAIAKRIIAETIAPRFRQGDYYGGVRAGVEQMIHVIEGEALPAPKAKKQDTSNQDLGTFLPVAFMLVLVVGGVLRAVFGRFFGSLATGGVMAVAAWLFIGALAVSVLAGIVGFILTLLVGGMGRGALWQSGGLGGFGGGSGGWGGGSSGGGFSGGGGSFGGGGASGDW